MTVRLLSGLFANREGLMSHGVALATTANNVSNANTTAYKSQRTEFQNLLAENLGGKYSTETTRFGNGSIASDVFTIQNQGVIEDTDRALDFAINGEGFFVVNDGTDTLYTRAGNFRIDSDGNLVDSDGRFVQGFTAASPDTLVPLNTSDIGSTSSPTTVVNMFGNVNASAELVAAADIPTAPATFNELTAASSFTTAVEVFDSLGARHPVTLNYYHTGPLEWTVQAWADAGETGGTVGVPALLGSGTMTFDAAGQQAEGAGLQLALTPAWANGATGSTFTVDMNGFTGFATPSVVTALNKDGTAPGQPQGFNLLPDGTLEATLDSGGTTQIGTVALAKFVNPGGLESVGGNNFRQTSDSGDPSVGVPKTEGRGELRGGGLESSNVDIAKEFIDMIRYQRGYQANSTGVRTLSDILNQTINIL